MLSRQADRRVTLRLNRARFRPNAGYGLSRIERVPRVTLFAFEMPGGVFDMKAHGRKVLCERVVQFARESSTFVAARRHGGVSEIAAFDREPDDRAHGAEELQCAFGERPPGGSGQVHDAEPPLGETQRDARVITDAAAEIRHALDRPQTTARNDVNVVASKRPRREGLHAPARLRRHLDGPAQKGR